MSAESPLRKRAKVEDEAAPMEVDEVHQLKQKSGVSVQEVMPLYYKRIFPCDEIFQADKTFSQRRELCFTLDGDIFVRYQSFADPASFRKALEKKVPAKIDIGPVYNIDPSRRQAYQASGNFVPVERELVFDIDMDGYDDVRTCCQGSSLCGRCWPLLTMALKTIDRVLRSDFGFRDILWVFSGRRGIHCWVCDPMARSMQDSVRAAIANYLEVYKGQEKGMARIDLMDPLHPSVAESLNMLREAFKERYLPAQRLLEDPQSAADLLRYVPDEDIRHKMLRSWHLHDGANGTAGGVGGMENMEEEPEEEKDGSLSVRRWEELEEAVESEWRRLKKLTSVKGAAQRANELKWCLTRVVLAYTYPRLDIEVSKKMNHLLKAPFCVHPKTGRVCVPIDPEAAWDFSPEGVPTVHELLAEWEAARAAGVKEPSLEDTSLKGAVELFRSKFLQGCIESSKQELAGRTRDQVAVNAASMTW